MAAPAAAHLASAVPGLDSIGSVARTTSLSFVIGTVIGFMTMAITGPGGPLAGAAIGTAPA